MVEKAMARLAASTVSPNPAPVARVPPQSSSAARCYTTKSGTIALSGVVTSHGEDHDPIISKRTVAVLEEANFVLYRWSPLTPGELSGKFRSIFLEMVSMRLGTWSLPLALSRATWMSTEP